MVSFLAPVVGEGVGFLRILRTLRLLRTYQLLDRLRADSAFFRANEEAILAATNLVVFVFVMTGIVYATQHGTNPAIGNYHRRALLHRDVAHDDRLRRHHPAGHDAGA